MGLRLAIPDEATRRVLADNPTVIVVGEVGNGSDAVCYAVRDPRGPLWPTGATLLAAREDGQAVTNTFVTAVQAWRVSQGVPEADAAEVRQRLLGYIKNQGLSPRQAALLVPPSTGQTALSRLAVGDLDWFLMDYHGPRNRLGGPSLSIVRGLLKDLLGALTLTHAAGVTHNDVKPGNIILYGDGTAALIDFGLGEPGKELRWPPMGGTMIYRSPELCRVHPSGQPADIWAAGATLWCLLTGSELVDPVASWLDEVDDCFVPQAKEAGWPSIVEACDPVAYACRSHWLRHVHRRLLSPWFPDSEHLNLPPIPASIAMPPQMQASHARLVAMVQELPVPELVQRTCENTTNPLPAGSLSLAADLLRRMLHPDPAARITAAAALHHRFLSGRVCRPRLEPPVRLSQPQKPIRVAAPGAFTVAKKRKLAPSAQSSFGRPLPRRPAPNVDVMLPAPPGFRAWVEAAETPSPSPIKASPFRCC